MTVKLPSSSTKGPTLTHPDGRDPSADTPNLPSESPGSSPANLLPLRGVEACQLQPRDADNSLGG